MSNKENFFFNKLNYTLANEDTRLEYQLLKPNQNHIVAICGSGARILPLLAQSPKTVTVIDSSAPQIEFLKLRLLTLSHYQYPEFLSFWGYRRTSPLDRFQLFQKLSHLTDVEQWRPTFYLREWSAPLYWGRWEKTMLTLGRFLRVIMGEKTIAELFSQSFDEQSYQTYLKQEFPWFRFRLAIRLLANPALIDYLLYRGGHAQFSPSAQHPTADEYYLSAFTKMIFQRPARENFFLQMLFLGSISYEEGLPLEADPFVFEQAKSNLSSIHFQFLSEDIISALSKFERDSIDFFSLSNIASYLPKALAEKYPALLFPTMRPSGIVVSRYYLNTPKIVDTGGLENVTAAYRKLIDQDQTTYFDFDLWEKPHR